MTTPPRSTLHRNGVRLFLALAATVAVLVGCPNPTNSTPLSPAEKILQEVRGRSLKSLVIWADPAAQAAIDSTSPASKPVNIIFYIIGGPLLDATEITTETALKTISDQIAPNPNYARVIVQQEQMIRYANKTLPTNRTITAEEAEEINLYSAAIVYAAGEKFRRMGHKVSLFSHSFGSFVVPEMLRRYGDEPFRKVLIAAGRLDMPEEVHRKFFNGIQAAFVLDTNNIASVVSVVNSDRTVREDVEHRIDQAKTKPGGYCGSPAGDPMAARICTGSTVDEGKKEAFINGQHSTMRLQADLGKNRYTTLLNGKLNKVIYYFGGQDAAVGSLTVREVNALAGKSAASDAGIGSIKFLTPDSSKQVTRNNVMVRDPATGRRVSQNVTRTVHTINHVSGRVAVRYTLEDPHALPLLFQDTLGDILESFGVR